MTEGKFYLDCPYDEKDMCKTIGGRWDADMKMWFVPESLDRAEFKRWWFKDKKETKKEVVRKAHLKLVPSD